MSLVSLTSVALARDLAAPGEPIKSDVTKDLAHLSAPAGSAQHSDGDTDPRAGGSVAGFTQLLVAQIPSEALLAYTTLLALFYVGGPSCNAGRWILYGSAIFACVATVTAGYIAQRQYGFGHRFQLAQHCSRSVKPSSRE